jgi:hypothetical protein
MILPINKWRDVPRANVAAKNLLLQYKSGGTLATLAPQNPSKCFKRVAECGLVPQVSSLRGSRHTICTLMFQQVENELDPYSLWRQ